MMPKTTLAAILALCGAGEMSLGSPSWAESSSPSWILMQSTANGGGGVSTGASHRLAASVAQESVIGTSSGTGHVLQSGFWAFVGSGLVPVLLTGSKNGQDPEVPDLAWTGNNPPYFVYRGVDCADLSAGYLVTEPGQSWSDSAPPASDIVCYSIFASAPGPVAPPGEWGLAPEVDGTVQKLPR